MDIGGRVRSSAGDNFPTHTIEMTTPAEIIITSGFDLTSISAADAARQKRDELLAFAKRGKFISDPISNARAAEILKDIKAFTRTVEVGRVAAKAPIIELGKKVDGLAGELVAELEAEAKRISGLVGAYTQEQERLAAEARPRAFEEEQRLRREAEEKQRKLDEEAAAAKRRQDEEAEAARQAQQRESDRIAKEAEEKAARARSDAGRERVAADAEKAQAALAEKARQDEAARQQQAEDERLRREKEAHDLRVRTETAAVQTRVAVPVAAKPAGISSRSDVKFEITDIVKLYEANAAFVILSPNNAALKAALKQLPEGQSLPGVRHWREASAIVR
jgi:DNA polymerase III gamma/tau subunit